VPKALANAPLASATSKARSLSG